MSLFAKMFGRRTPLEQMRRDVSQGSWAAAFNLARSLDRSEFSDEERQEVSDTEQRAGDKLATLNLEEGEGELRNGNLLRAREHFQLACEQARSADLQQQIKSALVELEKGDRVAHKKEAVSAASHCGGSCGPVGGVRSEGLPVAEDDSFDDEARFEVLLATLPEELADRYLATGEAFRCAWLVAHDGDPSQALKLFDEVPKAERDALFYCERGSQKGRLNDFKGASADLKRALESEPGLFVALSALVDLLVANNRLKDAEQLLRRALKEDRFPVYCQANLAQFAARRGDEKETLALATSALEAGYLDPTIIQICASLLEKQERFDEAEAVLCKLQGGGGCGGGAHPLLAEFWLRRNKNLDQALEAFKGALRQEQDNPRWLLRIGQTYAARGWKNEARGQLERLLGHPALTDELRKEAQATADQLNA